jgi:hypothetical protein
VKVDVVMSYPVDVVVSLVEGVSYSVEKELDVVCSGEIDVTVVPGLVLLSTGGVYVGDWLHRYPLHGGLTDAVEEPG